MPEYDAGFKIVAHHAGPALPRLAGHAPQDWEPLGDTLQATERLADRVFRARLNDGPCIFYFEAYTYWKASVPWSMLEKSGLISSRERLSTVCMAFILHPRGYSPQGGEFELRAGGKPRQKLWFDEVRLWEQEPAAWWEEAPGILPLLPLTRHGTTPEKAVQEAARQIRRKVGDGVVQADLLATLGFFGRLATPGLDVFGLIGREQMKESTFYQEILAEGLTEGLAKGRTEGLAAGRKEGQARLAKQLRAQFGPLSAAVRRRLTAMTQAQLDKLAIRLLSAKSLRELGLED